MKIIFQKNQIKYDTGKALLIKVPKQKYVVWIPSSLVKPKYWLYEAYIPSSMTFHLKYKDSQKNCSAQTLCSMFSNLYLSKSPEFETYTPPMLKPKKVKIDASLKR